MGLLEERVNNDLRQAMKDKDENRLSALRMLKAAIESLSIEKKRSELKDEDIIKLVRGLIRKHRDSIEQFTKGRRSDLVQKETMQLKVMESYVPEELSREELENLVKEAISETKAASRRDTGIVMKAVMEKAKGKADGKTISEIVAGLLK